ncbi:Neuroendocrine convertase 2,Furin-like protease 2,Proprotein convertase subtilisin/kexin type 4,Neuroendocrine convertase 1,Proprotein convertase subtilisin/kexin type 6,Furin,Proprotein convertase subtilisin/kexin type 5,Furin-like protease kpc-1 [Mytilus coruscus]|uniref:Peptidase S8/S53 domain-containing protein n=1 Tax=Mytilus coruscus TaxID=42192 RepID=A0A6J8A894_MYTCO|nr:Neuroendocrine convertase 2,Furin-like protease 2,Proprotein convertase subtilisin/kexin type 4,Neuroendocrine convertase 1,Proprotein convertase subtilisin/kexin type 6,Furin,Proprotein convertase subtilisin/kexin type 5,Furin-like protease kpc-1 [Mytilus coruscus]
MCNGIINCVLILLLHFHVIKTFGLPETIDEIVIELSAVDDTGSVTERFPNLDYVDKLTIGQRQFYKFKLKDNNGGHSPSKHAAKDTTIRALQTDSTNGNIYPSMNVHKAWEAGYTGSDVVIAIVDDGIQVNHPDLKNNVDTVNDYDYISFDKNPYPSSSSDSHGTNIAGLIAAERDNGKCVVGVAYNVSLIGVRLIGDYEITDFEQAQALTHYNSDVDIYTCSWGPEELYDFESMDFLTSLAIANNAKKGRSGKGIIYTWSAGNGGPNDNCNADGYVNSIYTIGVTALGIGKEADYAEVCAAALATVYGGTVDSYLMTTTTLSRCTDDGIEGTSFSAPIVAGIIALALHAKYESKS